MDAAWEVVQIINGQKKSFNYPALRIIASSMSFGRLHVTCKPVVEAYTESILSLQSGPSSVLENLFLFKHIATHEPAWICCHRQRFKNSAVL